MSQNPPTDRQLAKQLADLVQTIFQASCDEALDGDATEDFTKMFLMELDYLNGNLNEEEYLIQSNRFDRPCPEDEDDTNNQRIY